MQVLKQKCETFELKTRLAISSFKIAVLTSTEKQQGPLVAKPTVDPTGMEPTTLCTGVVDRAVTSHSKEPAFNSQVR